MTVMDGDGVAVEDAPKDGRAHAWTVIIYEDSCPEWRDVLRSMHLRAIVSPLHNADVTATGEPKKPHRHAILDFGRAKKSLRQVQEISDRLSGVKVLMRECLVRDMRAAVRYLVHYDDPDKAHYDIEGIECFGGADYLEHFADASDVDRSVGEMMEWLDNDKHASFSALARYARDNRPDWFRVLTAKRTIFVHKYAQAVTYERRCDLLDRQWTGVDDDGVPRCAVCGRRAVDSATNHRGGETWFCREHGPTIRKMIDDNVRFAVEHDMRDDLRGAYADLGIRDEQLGLDL